ncbi:hypothetical protein BD770DRAFT_382203 [Pilaira anomala]|nr:hypothetical protein BD770DRAFT_382203 [Pilaira anomala]
MLFFKKRKISSTVLFLYEGCKYVSIDTKTNFDQSNTDFGFYFWGVDPLCFVCVCVCYF